jgi:hypothetical protein
LDRLWTTVSGFESLPASYTTHNSRAKEFLAPDVIERGARVLLRYVKFVEDDLGLQRCADRIEIRPMHVGAHGGDRTALPTGQVLGEQSRGGRLTPIPPQTDHLAVHQFRQHGQEPLSLPALDLIEPDVSRLPFYTRTIPVREKRFLGATDHRHHPRSRQPQNPRTIAPRSNPSALASSTSRENRIQWQMANVESPFQRHGDVVARASCSESSSNDLRSNRAGQAKSQEDKT